MPKAQSRRDEAEVALVAPKELGAALRRAGHRVRMYARVATARSQVLEHRPRVIVLHVDRLPTGGIGKTVLGLRNDLPLTDVLLYAPEGTAVGVRDALIAGAKDVVLGPVSALVERVTSVLANQVLFPRLDRLHTARRRSHRFERLISRSDAMWDLFDQIVRIAPSPATVLVLGETGTGKELLARAVHRRSRLSGRFVAVNCGAVPETLIDAELFGFVKGAFTGATSGKKGLFRHATEGTLFLDEIGNLPLATQYRLLRVLQEGTVRPVGGHDEVEVNVRVVAATSAPLVEAVESGAFREALFYRLDVIRLEIPPLRRRPEDVVFLFNIFMTRFAKSYAVARPRPTAGLIERMVAFDWPGNVRQLENFAERCVLTHPGQRLLPRHLHRAAEEKRQRGKADSGPAAMRPPQEPGATATARGVDLRRPLGETIEQATVELELRYLDEALRETRGRIDRTAKMAGISRRTLLRKLKRHGLDKRSYKLDRSDRSVE